MMPSLRHILLKPFSSFQNVLSHLNDLRKDPDAFQKICQVAIAIIQGIGWYRGKVYLEKVVTLLDAANVDDFYDFLSIPYEILYPYNTERIDEEKLLDSLERYLSRQLLKQEGIDTIREITQQILTEFLKEMEAKETAFRKAPHFRTQLQNRFSQESHLFTQKGFRLDRINLDEMEIPLKKVSIFTSLEWVTKTFASLACIPDFLQEWNVIDLSGKAEALGKYRLLSWLPNQSLCQWVKGAWCLGFLFQFLEACRVLILTKPSAQERREAKWSLASSAAEFVFNFAAYQNREPILVTLFIFIAKSIGLLSILSKRNHQNA